MLSRPSDVLVVCGADKAAWPAFAGCCIELCRSNAEDHPPYTYGIPYVLRIGASNKKGSLLEILCSTRPSDATDPRDKFFGVLSLVRNEDTICRLASAATYDQSTTIIYTEIGLYLLRKDKLIILQVIRHPYSKFLNLASWIPDWSRTNKNNPFWLDIPGDDSYFDNLNFVPEFYTFKCCQPNYSKSDHLYHPILPVRGFQVSRIRSLGAVFDFKNSPKQCFDGVKQVIDTEGCCESNPYLPPAFMPDCE